MIGGLHITGLFQMVFGLYKSGTDWEVIIAGAAALAALSATWISYLQTKAQLRPILSYKKKVDTKENLSGFLEFRNVGQGAGTLLGVDVYPKDIDVKCHIATPLSIGSGSDATIQIWLPKANEVYQTTLTLYYWDITKKCHATKVDFELEYQTLDKYPTIQKPELDVREPMEEIKAFWGLSFLPWHPTRLKKLYHWDPKIPRKYINNKYSKKNSKS